MTRAVLVIVHFGDTDQTVRLVGELSTLPGDFTVVVAANDGKPRPDGVEGRVVWNVQSNLGYFGGFHESATKISAPVYWILNNDLFSSPDIAVSETILRCTTLLEEHPNIGIVAPALEQRSTKLEKIHIGDSFPAFVRRPGPPLIATDDIPNELIAVDWIAGACFAMQSSVAVGQLDTSYFLGGEDIDISYRTWSSGLAVTTAPALKISHSFSTAIGATNWWYLGPRAMSRFLRTHSLHWNLAYYAITQVSAAVLDRFKGMSPSRSDLRERSRLRLMGVRDGALNRDFKPLADLQKGRRST